MSSSRQTLASHSSPDLLQALPVGVLLLNQDGVVVFANESAARLLGGPADKLRGRRAEQLRLDGLPQLLAMKQDLIDETVTLTAPGQLPRSLRIDATRAANGAETVVTIAERAPQLDADTLKALVEQGPLKTIVENAPVGMAMLRGRELRFEIINPAFQALAPGTPLVGRTFHEAASEMPEIEAILRDCLHDGKPRVMRDMASPIQRVTDGPVEEGYFTFACVRANCARQENVVVGVAFETTDRVLALQKLARASDEERRREAEFESVFANVEDGLCVWDTNARLRLASASILRMVGLEASAALGETAEEILSRLSPRTYPERTPMHPREAPLFQALRGRPVRLFDMMLANWQTGRDMVVRVTSSPIVENGVVTGSISVLRDVTELVALDELKDQFLRVAAHELKTPVAVMKGYALALLQSTDDLAPARRRMLEAINRGSDRLERIVQDLLDLSQLDIRSLELTREPVELTELVQGLADRLALAHRLHNFQVRHSGAVTVQADRFRLSRVITNLLDNAVRYSPNGGDIMISITMANDRATVSVEDHGVGIPREKQARIFERFYRAHTDTPYDFGGMGVGLYLSKAIIEAHGGRIWFDSDPKRGSTFSFDLPVEGSRDGT